jgi:plasmid stabilization system protein ParE
MKLDQKVARQPEINPLNTTNHEKQKENRAADQFFSSLLAEHPLQFPVVYRNRRRAGVRRFPYGIFFEVQDNRIVVIACFHCRRNPRRWQSR